MTSIENGKSVVLFGFGFSGSGKTYTLIEGGTGDTSILYQFINQNQAQINSVEFLEIYPDPDKPTFIVGNGICILSNHCATESMSFHLFIAGS